MVLAIKPVPAGDNAFTYQHHYPKYGNADPYADERSVRQHLNACPTNTARYAHRHYHRHSFTIANRNYRTAATANAHTYPDVSPCYADPHSNRRLAYGHAIIASTR
jgi:hypothetical protein